jgi:hypothetical protein
MMNEAKYKPTRASRSGGSAIEWVIAIQAMRSAMGSRAAREMRSEILEVVHAAERVGEKLFAAIAEAEGGRGEGR